MYLRYSDARIANQESLDGDIHFVNVDRDTNGDIVGIEIVAPDDESVDLVAHFVHENSLSLRCNRDDADNPASLVDDKNETPNDIAEFERRSSGGLELSTFRREHERIVLQVFYYLAQSWAEAPIIETIAAYIFRCACLELHMP